MEAGCCGLANALLQSLIAAGCSAAEVLRTCRSADGLPLLHAALLSPNPAMPDLVWRWGTAAGVDMGPRPGLPAEASAEAACAAQPGMPPTETAALMAGAGVNAEHGALGYGSGVGASLSSSRADFSSGVITSLGRLSASSAAGSTAWAAPQRGAQTAAAAVALGAVAVAAPLVSRAPSRSPSLLSVGASAPLEAAPSPQPSPAGVADTQAQAPVPSGERTGFTTAWLLASSWDSLRRRKAPAQQGTGPAGSEGAGAAPAPLPAPAGRWLLALLRLLRGGGMLALRGGDRAVAALHAGLLRASPLYDSRNGGVVEQHFLW